MARGHSSALKTIKGEKIINYKHIFLLRHIHNATSDHFRGRQGGNTLTLKRNLTFRRPGFQEAVDCFQDGAFARAVAIGEGGDFLRADLERPVGEHLFLPDFRCRSRQPARPTFPSRTPFQDSTGPF